MQVNLLSRDDTFLVALDAEHLEYLSYLFSFIRFNDPVGLRIRLMNLTTLFRHFHKLISFEFFLFVKDCAVLLVEVVTDFLISGVARRAACLRAEQRLAGLRVYIFKVVTKLGAIR